MKLIKVILSITILFALTCHSVSAKMHVEKSRDNGFLWHYDRVSQNVYNLPTGDVLVELICTDPGWSRCRPSNVGGPALVAMDDAEVLIEAALGQNITSGTINYSDIEYFVVWSATETTVIETWYTYAEAEALELM